MIVEMDSVVNQYTVFGVEISSISICTADVLDGVSISSCLDVEVDMSSNYNAFTDANAQILSTDTTDTNEIFSFDLPLLSDDGFFVDVTVLLTYNNGNNVRRVLLQDNNGYNRYSTVVGSASLSDSSNNNGNSKSSYNNKLNTGGIIGITIACIVLISIIVVAIYFGFKYSSLQKAVVESQAVHVVKTTSQQTV